MNILIVGCGKVGAALASRLCREGHDISVIDKNPEQFSLLAEDFIGMTTAGIPIDQEVLKRAGIENCDAVAAVSEKDNINIMVCQLAQHFFHIPKVLARVHDPKREGVFSHFGLPTVCPTNLTVAAMESALTEEQPAPHLQLGIHTASFSTAEVPPHLVGTDLRRLALPEGQALFAIRHENGDLTLWQGQDYTLQADDKLIVSRLID